ncbi:MAG: capsule assembly Wzi family protein [Spirochaetales bacterium]|nr:capsule assembly Wzi family protein [Spirochaetales bacterium]
MKTEKTIFAILLFIFFSCSSLLAGEANLQKIYPVDSWEFEAVSHLYIEEGMPRPSSSGPWSGAELALMLSRLDTESLSYEQKKVYRNIYESLKEDSEISAERTYKLDLAADLTAEAYYHSNTDDFTEDQDWAYDYKARKPLLNLPFQSWATEKFYGYFEFTLRNGRFYPATKSSEGYFQPDFSTNLIFDDNFLNLDLTFPYRGFVSAGGDHWNLQFGRDDLRWGNGVTGNLMLNNHLDYHDFLKFTTFHDNFKFTTLAASFPHPSWGDLPFQSSQKDPAEGFQAFITHRLEFQLFDSLNIAVSEAMMFMGYTFDFRFLNPAMIYHDYYMRANSNSILGLDVDFPVTESLNGYASIVIDEFALPGEPTDSDNARPGAHGYIAGLRFAKTLPLGMLHLNLEGAYTDPYLYLRDAPATGDEYSPYPIDFIVERRQFTYDSKVMSDQNFLGYEYGGDAVVIDLQAGLSSFENWEITGELMYMLHGTHNLDTEWQEGSDAASAVSPTSESLDDPAKDAVEKTLLLEIAGSYNFLENASVFGQLNWISIQNINNVKANGDASDLQAALGLSYSF